MLVYKGGSVGCVWSGGEGPGEMLCLPLLGSKSAQVRGYFGSGWVLGLLIAGWVAGCSDGLVLF